MTESETGLKIITKVIGKANMFKHKSNNMDLNQWKYSKSNVLAFAAAGILAAASLSYIVKYRDYTPIKQTTQVIMNSTHKTEYSSSSFEQENDISKNYKRIGEFIKTIKPNYDGDAIFTDTYQVDGKEFTLSLLERKLSDSNTLVDTLKFGGKNAKDIGDLMQKENAVNKTLIGAVWHPEGLDKFKVAYHDLSLSHLKGISAQQYLELLNLFDEIYFPNKFLVQSGINVCIAGNLEGRIEKNEYNAGVEIPSSVSRALLFLAENTDSDFFNERLSIIETSFNSEKWLGREVGEVIQQTADELARSQREKIQKFYANISGYKPQIKVQIHNVSGAEGLTNDVMKSYDAGIYDLIFIYESPPIIEKLNKIIADSEAEFNKGSRIYYTQPYINGEHVSDIPTRDWFISEQKKAREELRKLQIFGNDPEKILYDTKNLANSLKISEIKEHTDTQRRFAILELIFTSDKYGRLVLFTASQDYGDLNNCPIVRAKPEFWKDAPLGYLTAANLLNSGYYENLEEVMKDNAPKFADRIFSNNVSQFASDSLEDISLTVKNKHLFILTTKQSERKGLERLMANVGREITKTRRELIRYPMTTAVSNPAEWVLSIGAQVPMGGVDALFHTHLAKGFDKGMDKCQNYLQTKERHLYHGIENAGKKIGKIFIPIATDVAKGGGKFFINTGKRILKAGKSLVNKLFK